jgi:hypothetical protein
MNTIFGDQVYEVCIAVAQWFSVRVLDLESPSMAELAVYGAQLKPNHALCDSVLLQHNIAARRFALTARKC